MTYQEEIDELRNKFRKVFPDVNLITQKELHLLIWILDDEFERFWLSGDHLKMYTQPLNRYVANMIREKGLKYKGVELKCGAHYFSNRNAFTFTPDGRVYFCDWVGGCNYVPFLSAFKRWLESER